MSQLIVKAQLFLLYVLHIQNKEVTDIFQATALPIRVKQPHQIYSVETVAF